MKITKETDYAIRALTFLIEAKEESVDAKLIAKTQCIPESFMFKVLRKLVKSGLVLSIRGANGGYKLNKSPREITLLDIIDTIEGLPVLNGCLDEGATCPVKEKNGYCRAHGELYRIQCMLRQELGKKSLEEILK